MFVTLAIQSATATEVAQMRQEVRNDPASWRPDTAIFVAFLTRTPLGQMLSKMNPLGWGRLAEALSNSSDRATALAADQAVTLLLHETPRRREVLERMQRYVDSQRDDAITKEMIAALIQGKLRAASLASYRAHFVVGRFRKKDGSMDWDGRAETLAPLSLLAPVSENPYAAQPRFERALIIASDLRELERNGHSARNTVSLRKLYHKAAVHGSPEAFEALANAHPDRMTAIRWQQRTHEASAYLRLMQYRASKNGKLNEIEAAKAVRQEQYEAQSKANDNGATPPNRLGIQAFIDNFYSMPHVGRNAARTSQSVKLREFLYKKVIDAINTPYDEHFIGALLLFELLFLATSHWAKLHSIIGIGSLGILAIIMVIEWYLHRRRVLARIDDSLLAVLRELPKN